MREEQKRYGPHLQVVNEWLDNPDTVKRLLEAINYSTTFSNLFYLWQEEKEQSSRKEEEMASFSKASSVILSSDLATRGIHEILVERNVGYFNWFSGDRGTLVGLFGLLQRKRAAIDELRMAMLFVLSLEKAWREDCAGTPKRERFDDETIKEFVVDGCFGRVWDSVCRVSHLVTDDEMDNFFDAAASILANAHESEIETDGFWERVLKEQSLPDNEFGFNDRQWTLSSQWLKRPGVFRALAQNT